MKSKQHAIVYVGSGILLLLLLSDTHPNGHPNGCVMWHKTIAKENLSQNKDVFKCPCILVCMCPESFLWPFLFQ